MDASMVKGEFHETRMWLLRPRVDWEPWFDKSFGFVVCAKSEERARELAEAGAGDESRHYGDAPRYVWKDASVTSCVELRAGLTEEVVMRDFASA